MHKKNNNKLISLWSKCLIYNYIRVPCISLHSISTRARIVCFFLWSRALLIFTQAASGKYIFQNGSGASGKRAEQKRIFHFAQTNAKLRFADLHEDARALVFLCLPGNVGNGLPSQVKCRKSTKKWKKKTRESKKWWQLQVQQYVVLHNDCVVAWTLLSLDKFRRQTEEERKVVVVVLVGSSGTGKDRRGEEAYEIWVFVAWRWHFDINLAGSRKTAPPAHRKHKYRAQGEGGRGEDEGMGEVISSEMCCSGNKQAGATMRTADNKRGENVYEKHSDSLPNKSQIKNRCQINRVEIKTRQRGRSILEDQRSRILCPPYANIVSHLLGPEPPGSPFSSWGRWEDEEGTAN